MTKFSLYLFCFLILMSCSNKRLNQHKLPNQINEEKLLSNFKRLSSNNFQGRKTGTKGNLKAQQFIKDQLNKLKVTPFQGKFLHPFTFTSHFTHMRASNVIGLIEGVNEKSGYIILTAHFDHLGQKADKIFNGADDNASGTASLLAIAENVMISPLSHHVIFLFTDAEESNLKGSKAFMAQNEKLIDKIKLNINVDMIAGAKASQKLHFFEKGLTEKLTKPQKRAFNQYHHYQNFNVKKGFKNLSDRNRRTHWLSASDHYVFYRNKIPFIYYGVGTHQNYHSVNDEYENTNLSLLINSTNVIYQQLRFLDAVM